jgi:ubiquitin-conjugating enzyme E2 variant
VTFRPECSDIQAIVVPAPTTTVAPVPGHDAISWTTRTVEIAFIIAATLLLAANVARAGAAGVFLHWWTPFLVLLAAYWADFVSGIVHWVADTWFSETMPVLGRRFLRPFRVHHVNPDDFLRRSFADCNGDVAMLNTPILMAALAVPVSSAGGAALLLVLIVFAATSLPTNQVHQWAHMPDPPAAVRWLQRTGLILSRDDHARHHRHPYVANYCIATGWCNRWLSAAGFFPACERAITRCFGIEPRADERTFHERHRSVRLQPDQRTECRVRLEPDQHTREIA